MGALGKHLRISTLFDKYYLYFLWILYFIVENSFSVIEKWYLEIIIKDVFNCIIWK